MTWLTTWLITWLTTWLTTWFTLNPFLLARNNLNLHPNLPIHSKVSRRDGRMDKPIWDIEHGLRPAKNPEVSCALPSNHMLSWSIMCYPKQLCAIFSNWVLLRANVLDPWQLVPYWAIMYLPKQSSAIPGNPVLTWAIMWYSMHFSCYPDKSCAILFNQPYESNLMQPILCNLP